MAATDVAGGMGPGIVGEDGEGAAHQAHDPVRMAAGSPAVDLAQAPGQPVRQSAIGPPGPQQFEVVGDGRQPVDARPALARTLAGEPGA